MPIVDEKQGGLKRYAVITFVEDTNVGRLDSPAMRFPMSPHASSLEASTKLGHTEMFHMKRLKSLEKNVNFPFADLTFFSSYQGTEEMRNLLEPNDCVNLHDHSIKIQKGCFEEVQLVDPKRDMIMTPIDVDDVISERLTGKGVTSQNKVPIPKSEKKIAESEEDYKKTRGYIVIAYKTMEHMYSRDFVSSWKTWTGVRYICMQLPRQLGLRRIAFYRQISATSDFTYVLLIEIMNLLVYAAQTLNLMDGIKLRLCGYTGIYREMDFQVDLATAAVHHMETTYRPPDHNYNYGTPKINVVRNDSDDSQLVKRQQPTDENVQVTDNLSDMFKKQTEIANKRRQEQEVAMQLEEHRKAKLFKLFGRRDSIPNYDPPPPPPPQQERKREKKEKKIKQKGVVPTASPESEPDVSPPSPILLETLDNIPVPQHQYDRYPSKQRSPRHWYESEQQGNSGEYRRSDEKRGVTYRYPVVKPIAEEYSMPIYADVQPQIVHSLQIAPQRSCDVQIIQPQQQMLMANVPVMQQQVYPQQFPPAMIASYPPYGNENPSNILQGSQRRSEIELLKAGSELARSMQGEIPLIQVEVTRPQPSPYGPGQMENFNSPNYSRTDWKNGSMTYPGTTHDEHMHHLAQKLNAMKETAILFEEMDRGRPRYERQMSPQEMAEDLIRRRSLKREKGAYRDRSHSYSSNERAARMQAAYGSGVSLADRRQVYFQLQEKSRNMAEHSRHRKSMPSSTHELLVAFNSEDLQKEMLKRKRHKEKMKQEEGNLKSRSDVVDIIEPRPPIEQQRSPRRDTSLTPRRVLPKIPILSIGRESPAPTTSTRSRQHQVSPRLYQSRLQTTDVSRERPSQFGRRAKSPARELRQPSATRKPTPPTSSGSSKSPEPTRQRSIQQKSRTHQSSPSPKPHLTKR